MVFLLPIDAGKSPPFQVGRSSLVAVVAEVIINGDPVIATGAGGRAVNRFVVSTRRIRLRDCESVPGKLTTQSTTSTLQRAKKRD
jgi:hypothetical protein